ncbi:MAG: MoxR family ATPase, partial [Ectothiorhodospiraceae bacterium]
LEGTYPLPEAQLDRFMFEIVLDYLPEDEELAVVQATTGPAAAGLQAIISRDRLIDYQRLTRRVTVADDVARYAVQVARASRPGTPAAAQAAQRWLTYGASVRAAQYLVLAGKARALTQGRVHVGFDDVRALARPVLRHRLLRNFQAESEQVSVDSLVDELLASVTPQRQRGTA